jgi:Na+/H+ antiporter NhaD/arsenite permease-like protein
MNTAILISLAVPAVVATVLTIMRDYFFYNKQISGSENLEKREESSEQKRSSDDLTNLDFSGGTLGL